MMCSKRFPSAAAGRRGSALLIVLGMFAFMLVSAVSFSIYMRASRAPSSYVRRNASARHLVKAALARAIDEIDTAIGNDPFPGVGYNNTRKESEQVPNPGTLLKSVSGSYKGKNNNWRGRVFMPMGAVPAKDTVSTLTLEGLGYIPPCLVNEARYWSRHTRTAKTPRPFGYGLGEYAFTAINVSDFFDLGVLAGKDDGQERQYLNRSSAPHGRISPTYLFRGGETVDAESDLTKGEGDASEFLDSLANGRKEPADIPLVSLMDFNLTYRDKPWAVKPPFLAKSGMYLGGEISKEDALGQVFMAGGWNGHVDIPYNEYNMNNVQRRINLHYPECQPFSGYAWFPAATTLSHCYNDVAENHPFWQPVMNDFPIISTALLCDYLDYDNVPLSLCIPCTEAVPMICGVELNDGCVNYNVAVAESVLQEANAEQGKKKKIKRTYSLKVEVRGLETVITTVYPFMNGPQGQKSNYTIESFARVFFTTESPLGDGDVKDVGLRASNSGLGAVDNAQWDWSGTTSPAYIQVTCGDKGLTAAPVLGGDGGNDSVELNAIRDDKDSNLRMIDALVKDAPLADLVYEVDEDGKETLVDAECVGYDNFRFYDNWVPLPKETILDNFKNDTGNLKYRPSVAVWARVKNSDNKTVDMVPAIPTHDALNECQANEGVNKFNEAMGGVAGEPLIRFFPKKEGGHDIAGIVFTKQYFDANKGTQRTPEWKQKAYFANDPRINWAPEHWWATLTVAGGANFGKNHWFINVKSFRESHPWCDSDIFMSVSDQGYMQSMYEWLHIPQVLRVRRKMLDYNANGANLEWGVFEGGNGYDGVVNDSVSSVSHSDVMWRTYTTRAFLGGPENDNWDWGRLDLLPFDDSVVGLRVNPYTDITNIMMGAFANMPRDWWAASTNHNASGKGYMEKTDQFERKYLFNWSKVNQDVYYMSRFWMSVFRGKDLTDADNLYRSANGPDPWEERLDGYTGSSYGNDLGYSGGLQNVIDWFTGEVQPNYTLTDNHAMDVQGILQNDLTLADRKFLYGYLKGCFANTHQLFLVFVRAESAAGGGGAGSGARAVALVWRDPRAPEKASGRGEDNARLCMKVDEESEDENSWRLEKREHPPHRCRVLFYHQLD